MKFNFPELTERDIHIIKQYCKMMEYKSVIDRKNRIAKIVFNDKSIYVVKIPIKGKIVLGVAKTTFDANGNLIYTNFENLYVKFSEAEYALKTIGGFFSTGNMNVFFRAVYGLAYFLETTLSLQKLPKNKLSI